MKCHFLKLRLHIYIYIYIYWIGPREDLFFKLFIFLHHVFLVFHFLLEVIIVDDGVLFELNNDNCFDKAVVLFDSMICVWEFSDRVNYPWQIYDSAGVISHFLLFHFFYFSIYKSVFNVYICLLEDSRPCTSIYFRFFLLLFFPQNNLW